MPHWIPIYIYLYPASYSVLLPDKCLVIPICSTGYPYTFIYILPVNRCYWQIIALVFQYAPLDTHIYLLISCQLIGAPAKYSPGCSNMPRGAPKARHSVACVTRTGTAARRSICVRQSVQNLYSDDRINSPPPCSPSINSLVPTGPCKNLL